MKSSQTSFAIPARDSSLREGTGISNLDGRLWDEMGFKVGRFFGDEAVVRARVAIEARYLIALSKAGRIRKLGKKEANILLRLHEKVDSKVYKQIREIETEARHDVIAMTQVLKKLLGKYKKLDDIVTADWIHWGLASEDVDNLSKATLTMEFLKEEFLPQASLLLGSISVMAKNTKNVTIPGRTHMQPAVPTTLGKEIALFGVRLAEVFERISDLKLRGKLTGAVGNLSAQRSAAPEINWLSFSKKFVESLGLETSLFTTQIEPRNRWAELLDLVETLDLILVDLSQDARLYIGFDWLVQEAKKEEFGSSAMPQKVNPIDFENSQGNALLANWIIEGLKRQLLVSWLQRDLVDKTILRNLGLPFGYSLIAMISAVKGLTRVSPNKERITKELNSDLSILAEAYQINLRALGLPNAYDKLKDVTRGRKITKENIGVWLDGLDVPEKVKTKLRRISPENYLGYAKENTQKMLTEIERVRRKLA
ncbi:hypothetical protein HYT60_02165 [Candidatus Woesebacteria bacterium]|nr:hypothetical protein [Candidatus Woesebacteria bacterium]